MKIKNISIIASLAAALASLFFSEVLLTYLALILIISIGILHGANDIILIQKTQLLTSSNKVLSTSLYSIIVLVAIGLFYLVPFVALVTFVIFSAYHFGEQHWSKKIKTTKYSLLAGFLEFLFGLLILSLLFYLKSDQTNEIIYDLAKFTVPNQWFAILSLVSAMLSFSLIMFFIYHGKITFKHASSEILYLLLFALVFYFTPLILGFSIYFVFWHSLPSLKDQIDFIYEENLQKGVMNYVKDAGIYWGISVMGFILFLIFFYETKLFYSFLFSFIAAITFPHVIVMGKMFSYLQKENK